MLLIKMVTTYQYLKSEFPKTLFFDQNKDLLNQEKETVSVDGVNGPDLVLGSLTDVSTSGNWPTTFDVETK